MYKFIYIYIHVHIQVRICVWQSVHQYITSKQSTSHPSFCCLHNSDNKQNGVKLNPSKTGGSKNPNAWAEPLTTQGYEPKCTKPMRTDEPMTIKGYETECAQAGTQPKVSARRQRFDKPVYRQTKVTATKGCKQTKPREARDTDVAQLYRLPSQLCWTLPG